MASLHLYLPRSLSKTTTFYVHKVTVGDRFKSIHFNVFYPGKGCHLYYGQELDLN